MAAYSTTGYGSDYINQQIAAASGQGTGTYYQRTVSQKPKYQDRPRITGGAPSETFSGLTNTPENQALFGAETFAPQGPSPLQQKDAIEQGVVDRGLQSGATGVRSGAGGRSAYSDEQIAFMTGGGGGGGATPPTGPTGTSTPPTNPGTPTDPGNPGNPDAPVAPGAPTTAGDNFGQYTEAEIDAALRGIEAEFGMTREQLLQDKSMIGAQYRLLMARMARAREQALGSATSDAVSRGIYRSGILGENLADVEQQYQEQSGGARQQQQIQEQTLERQLALLDQGQAARGAQVQNQILGQAAATMQQAGIDPAGAGFTQGGFAPNSGQLQTGNTPIPAQGMGPGTNPYEGFPIVSGYYIDPNTGMAAARVDSVGVPRAQEYY